MLDRVTEFHSDSQPIKIDRERLKVFSKKGSVFVEQGNALHDMVASIEQDEKISIRGVELNFGGGKREIGYQITSGNEPNNDIDSEIYSGDIIIEALGMLLSDSGKGVEFEMKIADLKAGKAIVIPFDIVDKR